MKRSVDRSGAVALVNVFLMIAWLTAGFVAGGCAAQQTTRIHPEVRGTWLTTTANDHIASPERTGESMRRLREIGLNTVYVETWKNGYTQYPSQVLKDLIGVDRRPDLAKQDPSDSDEARPARDLLQETLIEAHRNELLYIGWFEYGFMAAHQSTMNHLRELRPDWLSRNIDGEIIAPNGFVWLNPLHPEARRFLADIVLEAIDQYDMDGVQLDDRIVWPHVTMGYDKYTRAVYANEHGGRQPPEDYTDPDWIAWRSSKIDEYAQQFVDEIRAKRPGLIVSVSPAPYPWVYENYCLDWIEWAMDDLWDEYIPQCYRYDHEAFVGTWDQQVEHLEERGASDAVALMLAGVLTTGSRPDPVPWEDLRKSVEHVRETGGGGHVWWFSRGVLDEYPEEISGFYDVARNGQMPHPRRPADWRPAPIVLQSGSGETWTTSDVAAGTYRVIAKRNGAWFIHELLELTDEANTIELTLPADVEAAELLVDRRPDMRSPIVMSGKGGS